MIQKEEINKIKKTVEEFLDKMTIGALDIDVRVSAEKREPVMDDKKIEDEKEVVDLDIKISEPQILIGQQGQTLFEIQRLLRMILNRKLQKSFYLNLDIDSYKKKKIEYLKALAKDEADQVALNKEEKSLQPMSSYERRVIHAELSQRTDITTESRGEGYDRHIVIKPK